MHKAANRWKKLEPMVDGVQTTPQILPGTLNNYGIFGKLLSL